MGPDKGGAIGRSLGRWDPSSRPLEPRFQLQSFAEAMRRDARPGAARAPSGMCPLGAARWPRASKSPTLEDAARWVQGPPCDLPTSCERHPPCRLASSVGLFPPCPFVCLTPGPPQLAANRREAPLAFRMKSSDFLSSSGHSCIRSGLRAFPTQCVKFVFEGWGRGDWKMPIFRSCTLTDPPPLQFGRNSFLKSFSSLLFS